MPRSCAAGSIDHVWIEEISVTNHLHDSRATCGSRWRSTRTSPTSSRSRTAPSREREVSCDDDDRTPHARVRREGLPPLGHDRLEPPRRRSLATGSTYSPELGAGRAVVDHASPSRPAPPSRGTFTAARPRGTIDELSATKSAELEAWLAGAPVLRAGRSRVARTYRASLSDLARAAPPPRSRRGATLPAAGLPWFMALFGRDSLITSFQALPYLPGLAATTLRVLAAARRQPRRLPRTGARQDPARAALRRAHRARRATPLALLRHRRCHAAVPVLLDEYHRWSGDDELVRDLEPQRPGRARLDRRQRRPRRRRLRRVRTAQSRDRPRQPVLEGQLERDPVRRRHARAAARSRPARSRATSTTRSGAAPAWPARSGTTRARRATRARGRATLRARFQRDFWMPERGYHALALDGDKRQVDSLTSNIGHLLWSGLLDEAEAAATAERLLDERALLRLGRPHARRRARPATTRSATTPAPSGPTTTR